jgi:hypothetical protein
VEVPAQIIRRQKQHFKTLENLGETFARPPWSLVSSIAVVVPACTRHDAIPCQWGIKHWPRVEGSEDCIGRLGTAKAGHCM